jgi:RNA polymerase sigma-70 factor, ECF subfamily
LADRRIEFEEVIMPHLAAAHDLARWLMRHPQDAEDVVQEAYLKAFRAFDRYADGHPKAWILAIVRNTAMSRLSRRPASGKVVALHEFDDEVGGYLDVALHDPGPRPDAVLLANEQRESVHRAIAQLTPPLREVIVLREFHELSYQQIAVVVGAPVGTVMSRLARARDRLLRLLTEAARAQEQGDRSSLEMRIKGR